MGGVTSSPTFPFTTPKPSLIMSMRTPPPSDHQPPKYTASTFLKTVCLEDWWLIKCEDENVNDDGSKKLGVEGFTSREQKAVRRFSSAPIVKRFNLMTIETADGIAVLLHGLMNKSRTCENGFSKELCRHFQYGFPFNWEALANKCLRTKSNSVNTIHKSMPCISVEPENFITGGTKGCETNVQKETFVNNEPEELITSELYATDDSSKGHEIGGSEILISTTKQLKCHTGLTLNDHDSTPVGSNMKKIIRRKIADETTVGSSTASKRESLNVFEKTFLGIELNSVSTFHKSVPCLTEDTDDFEYGGSKGSETEIPKEMFVTNTPERLATSEFQATEDALNRHEIGGLEIHISTSKTHNVVRSSKKCYKGINIKEDFKKKIVEEGTAESSTAYKTRSSKKFENKCLGTELISTRKSHKSAPCSPVEQEISKLDCSKGCEPEVLKRTFVTEKPDVLAEDTLNGRHEAGGSKIVISSLKETNDISVSEHLKSYKDLTLNDHYSALMGSDIIKNIQKKTVKEVTVKSLAAHNTRSSKRLENKINQQHSTNDICRVKSKRLNSSPLTLSNSETKIPTVAEKPLIKKVSNELEIGEVETLSVLNRNQENNSKKNGTLITEEFNIRTCSYKRMMNVVTASEVNMTVSVESLSSYQRTFSRKLESSNEEKEGLHEKLGVDSSKTKKTVKSVQKVMASPLTRAKIPNNFVSPVSLSCKKSRSGRLLKPPVEFWRNQQVIYDMEGGVVGLQDGLPGIGSPRDIRSAPPRKRKRLF